MVVAFTPLVAAVAANVLKLGGGNDKAYNRRLAELLLLALDNTFSITALSAVIYCCCDMHKSRYGGGG
jgi:hypothetical protein